MHKIKSFQDFQVIVANLPQGVVLVQTKDSAIVYANPAMERLLGYAPHELTGKPYRAILAATAETAAGFDEILKTPNLPNGRWQSEIQMTTKNGAILWCDGDISSFDHPIYGLVWVMIHRDITGRKQIEKALLDTERKFHYILDWSSDSIFCNNENGEFVFVNRVYATNFQNEPEYFIGKTFWDIYTKEEADFRQEIVKRIFKTGKSEVMEGTVSLPGKNVFFLITINPIKDEDGKVVLVLTHATDITARKEIEDLLRENQEQLKETNQLLQQKMEEINSLHEILREEAIRDSLTGLYNRRYLTETMEREIARAKRENYPICMMMIDIDFFKSLNDSYGHLAGDEVLKALASLLQISIRQGDISCRYGGEEFIIIMHDISVEDAKKRADSIRYDFDCLPIQHTVMVLHATISIGIAFFPQHGNSPDELIGSADVAMYRAKRNGRNQINVWE